MPRRWSNIDLESQEKGALARLRRSYRGLVRENAKSKWLLILAQILATVCVPAAVAGAVNLITGSDASLQHVGWIILGAVIILQALLLVCILVGPSTPHGVLEDLDHTAERLEEYIAHSSSLDRIGGAFAEATACGTAACQIAQELIAASDGGQQIALREALEAIIRPYFDLRREALGFTGEKGHYTFTLFQVDAASQVIKVRGALQDSEIVRRERDLPIDRSHAGQAVLSQTTKITDDARLVAEFLEMYDQEDRQNYRSMASFPLFLRGEVFGAGTITCTVASQFSADGAEDIFDTLGGIISLYLSSRGSDAVQTHLEKEEKPAT